MYYFERFVLPKCGTELDNQSQDMEIDKGIIDYIDVEFPAGCCGLAYVVILLHTVQIVPYSKDQVLYGDDRTFHVDLNLPVVTPPYVLTLVGYNVDDTYQHGIGIGVNMRQDHPTPQAMFDLGGV